jgi:hypothetical protein
MSQNSISPESICLQHMNHLFQNKKEHQTSDDLTIKQTDSCPLSSNSGYVRLGKVDPIVSVHETGMIPKLKHEQSRAASEAGIIPMCGMRICCI